jgi:hypothetical protein
MVIGKDGLSACNVPSFLINFLGFFGLFYSFLVSERLFLWFFFLYSFKSKVELILSFYHSNADTLYSAVHLFYPKHKRREHNMYISSLYK